MNLSFCSKNRIILLNNKAHHGSVLCCLLVHSSLHTVGVSAAPPEFYPEVSLSWYCSKRMGLPDQYPFPVTIVSLENILLLPTEGRGYRAPGGLPQADATVTRVGSVCWEEASVCCSIHIRTFENRQRMQKHHLHFTDGEGEAGSIPQPHVTGTSGAAPAWWTRLH